MNEDQNEQRAEKFRLFYRFLRVCQRWIDEGCWSPLLAQRAHQNEEGSAWSVLVLAEGGTPETKMDRHPRWSFAPRTRTQGRSHF